MKRFQEEFRACNNNRGPFSIPLEDEEVPYPSLNLPLTKTRELMKDTETFLAQHYTSKPPENLKNSEKTKALNFPISKIKIGEWTLDAVNEYDLTAKFYFAKKKLMWESLDSIETDTNKTERLKRKIEMHWTDVLSLKPFYQHETGILKVELRRPPTFFMETNPRPQKHTQWKKMEQDFTLNQSASRNRIHILHFSRGVLQKNLEKLMSGNSFWSELFKVKFPTSEDLYFSIGYGNNNTNLIQGQTLSFNVNNDFLHQHSQGVGHEGVGEVGFNMTTQFGSQINSFVQGNSYNNTVNHQLLETQVIQPSSHYNFGGSQFCNSMFQDVSLMGDAMELRASQALLETQTNSMMLQHMNQPSMYPQVNSYEGYLPQQEETQNMEHLDGNFQINGNEQIDSDADFAYFLHLINNDVEDGSNGAGL